MVACVYISKYDMWYIKAGLLTVFIENAQFPRILSRDRELAAKELKHTSDVFKIATE